MESLRLNCDKGGLILGVMNTSLPALVFGSRVKFQVAALGILLFMKRRL
jgi:hypothetical protein